MAQRKKLTKLGKRIKKRIVDLNLTQKEFCELCGIRECRLSDVMYTDLRADLREKVCKILGIGA